MPGPRPTLPLTGERTVPGVPREAYWFARHEAAYLWAGALLRSAGVRDVVDAGCGEGYGAALLAAAGMRVAALELDPGSCAHAAAAYPEVALARANLAALPLRSGAADAVVAMQVVEHLWDLRGFLRDGHRTLRPGGALVLSTPNRPVFSPGLGRGEKPTNPFHVEEFDADQLGDLVAAAGFAAAAVLGLEHGPRLRAWEESHGDLVAGQVEAAVTGAWPDDLAAFVAGVTADDFEVTADLDRAPDLLLVAVRP